MKLFFTLLTFLSITTNVSAQLDSIELIAKEMDVLQKSLLETWSGDNRDSVQQLFDAKVKELFSHPDFCDFQLDHTREDAFVDNPEPKGKKPHYLPYLFMNRMVSCASPDGIIKLFSWDNLNGGSYHSYSNYIQFETAEGSCTIIPFPTVLDKEEEWGPEVGYFQVQQVSQDNSTFYFILGYGTHGGGKQHKILRIVEVNEGELKECLSCYPNGQDIVVYTNRGQDSELSFDPETLTLTYKAFVMNEDVGFYTKEYKNVKLRFKNRQLIEK